MVESPAAIFLSGPIGSGKSTLGLMLANELRGTFIDGDEHADPNRPWYASSLSTARAIVRTVVEEVTICRVAIVAYPLRCIDWVYYRRCLAEHGIGTVFVSLEANYEAIASPSRHRSFTAAERKRIHEMIKQGYGHRPFSDIFLRTDQNTAVTSLHMLAEQLRRIRR